MMRLFITDTETNGLTADDQVCEIAATLYQIGDSEENTGAIASVSTLVPVISNNVMFVNGISPKLSQAAEKNNNSCDCQNLMQQMAMASDYCVAFNAEFDAPYVKKLLDLKENPPWLCAMKDFDWQYPNIKANGSFKLTDLALWMGIGISTVHRAGDDVRLLVECLNRQPYQRLEKMMDVAIARLASPIVEIRALVSYENRELAKTAGFIWNPQRRQWVKKIRECDIGEFPFEILIA